MTRTNPRQEATRSLRAAFTLVELLVVITIIGILAAMVLGVLNSARETARRSRTEALIAKLDVIVLERYDSYRTRRVSIDTRGKNPQTASVMRLDAIRETMRMEMPQCWDDVTKGPVVPGMQRTAINKAMLRRHSQAMTAATAAGTPGIVDLYGPAECLYLTVTLGSPDTRSTFKDREVDDVDGDGLKEFVDAWGNPIFFLRWAPGMVGSGVQPPIIPDDPAHFGATTAIGNWAPGEPYDVLPSPPASTSGLPGPRALAREEHPDPFDVVGIGKTVSGREAGWQLAPLIISAGPDGVFDIAFDKDETGASLGTNIDPFAIPYGVPQDAPTDGQSVTRLNKPANGELNHYDNIHNHSLEVN